MSSKLITAPTSEPITLAEAKVHLRVVGTDEDSLITSLIVAARQGAEQATGRALMPQTWEISLDSFPQVQSVRTARMASPYTNYYPPFFKYGRGEILITKSPLASVTSLTYIDSNGATQTISDYVLDSYGEPARITPAYGTSWPGTRDQTNAVILRYVAGYANAATVPDELKAWMLLRMGLLYENRESVVNGLKLVELPYIDRLLDAYKVWNL